MGKKKGGGQAANNQNGQVTLSKEKPAEPTVETKPGVQSQPSIPVEQITNGVAAVSLSAKEQGELARQHKSKEEVMAERKAKAAAKAAKAAAAASKKDAGDEAPAAKQTSQKQNNQDKSPKETPSASTKESSPENGVSSSSRVHSTAEEPKSAMKSGKQVHNKSNREVQFDLSANTVKSASSEECLAEKQSRPNVLIVPQPIQDQTAESLSTAHVHPAFLTLSSKCEHEQITDVDELCREFLIAFKKFLIDWGAERIRTPGVDSAALGQDLDLAIRPQLAYLTCDGRWPLPYALGNIIRQMKKEIIKLGSPDTHARTKEDGTSPKALPGGAQKLEDLQDWLEDTENSCFELATQAISEHLRRKMTTAKKIMTYDWCQVVNQVLVDAVNDEPHQQHIVVIDKMMNGKGVEHVKSLLGKDAKLEYGDLRSLGYAIEKCSMVLLGCSAVLSNGCVACPKGALQVALTAKANNVPLMVCAQTFKFVDKVQSYGRMSLLGRADVELVPADLVTAIVTDIRILPPSSAPAVLKAKALDME